MCRSANSINVQNYACKLLKAPYTERYVLVLWEGEAVRDRQLCPIVKPVLAKNIHGSIIEVRAEKI